MHKMLALFVRLVYNMCVSKKETKEYPVKVTKKKIEAILQKDERMKWVTLWYDRSAKQWIFAGGDACLWESSGTGIYRLDMLSVEEWVDYAYQLAGRKRYV